MHRRALFLALWAALPVGAQTPSRGSVFCCMDNGHQVCGDVLPMQCFGKSYREMSPQGTVRRIVEAPLTPEQSVSDMLSVIDGLKSGDNGRFYAHDGSELPW